MRGLCFFFLSILTRGKSIFCTFLFSDICSVLVGGGVCVCASLCTYGWVGVAVDFRFQNYKSNLQLIICHPPQSPCRTSVMSLASLGTMSPCPVGMTPGFMVCSVSVGDKEHFLWANAQTPSSPLSMGLWGCVSPPGTSCWAGWQMGMSPWPSWMLSGATLVCTAAGSRSPGGSMTIKSA